MCTLINTNAQSKSTQKKLTVADIKNCGILKLSMRKYGIVIAAMSAVIGLMVISSPEEFVKMIVIILGVVSLANGCFNLTFVNSFEENSFYRKNILIRSWSSIGVGLLAIFLPLVFAATLWTAMLYVLAFFLLVSAGYEFYGVLKLKNSGLSLQRYIIEIAVSVFLAIFLIMVPGKIGLMFVRLLGLALIGCGVVLGIVFVKNKGIIIEPDSIEDIDDLENETDYGEDEE